MLRRKRKNSSNGSEVQARLSAVRSDLDTLQKDVRGLVNEVGGVASREVQDAMGGAIHSAQEVVERLWSKENGGAMRDVLRNQPIAACVVSLGAGALIGALLLR